MVRYDPGHKEQTRTRIVEAASEVFKKDGVRKAKVEDVMKAAGLTAGAFYKHFDSKDSLLAEALSNALGDSLKNIQAASGEATGAEWEKTAAASYLSPLHRENMAQGCALPALAADVARASTEVREHFEDGLQALVGEIASHMEGSPEEQEQQAWQMAAMFVGGVLLARGVADKDLADKILADCRAAYDKP